MKKLVLAGLALLGLAVVALPTEAGHCRRHRGCDVGCGAAYECGSYTTVAWEEREVTAYRTEVQTRTVQREVKRLVSHTVQVPCTWYETVAVTTPQKQTVNYCET